MKNIKTYGIIVLALILITIVVVQNIRLGNLRYYSQLKDVELSTLKDSVKTFVTKNGELVSKITSIEVEKRNLKEALDIAGFDIKKLKDENVKWKNVNMALTAQLEAAGNVHTIVTDTFEIVKQDTIWYSKFDDWTNNYLSIYNGKIVNKSLDFDYKYQTGIKLLTEQSIKSTIVTAILSDPQAKITTANSITVVHNKKWYEKWYFWTAVGVTGGYLIAK